jgi:hypothetical protein
MIDSRVIRQDLILRFRRVENFNYIILWGMGGMEGDTSLLLLPLRLHKMY